MAEQAQPDSSDQLSLDEALTRLSERHGVAPQRAPFDLAKKVSSSLDGMGLSWEDRIQLIGGAFVVEALRPVWNECGGSADAAVALLRSRDPELADAVKALAPMLYGRHEAGRTAADAIDEVERLLQAL